MAFIIFFVQILVVVITEYCRPNKAVAWVMILYGFPIFGFLIYYFVAKEFSCFYKDQQVENKDIEIEKTRRILNDRCRENLSKHSLPVQLSKERYDYLNYNQKLTFPLTAGNETEIYDDGKMAFEEMLSAIANAKHHIHVQSYIIRDDGLGERFQQMLMKKASEGIKVRVLYDGIGCHRLSKSFIKRLEKAGVETGSFFPPFTAFIRKQINYRNHRKILVVDGIIGFLGGLNIGDEYLGLHPKFGNWRDTHFSIKGDAVLWIQYTFLTDWYMVKEQWIKEHSLYFPHQQQAEEYVQIVKGSPDETILELLFTSLVSAKRRVFIETPYFIPDPCILMALKTAAARGVDVRVIIPDVLDFKLVYWASLSYVRELMQSGVKFYRYQKGFIHAKVFIFDDWVCSGSTNLDMRSLYGQFEINAIFWDQKIVKRFVQHFVQDISHSHEMILTEQPAGLQKGKEILGRLLSPLF